jgi:hypothetical protein
LTAADFDTAELESLAGQSARECHRTFRSTAELIVLPNPAPASVEPQPQPANKTKGVSTAGASGKTVKAAAVTKSAPQRLPNGRYK